MKKYQQGIALRASAGFVTDFNAYDDPEEEGNGSVVFPRLTAQANPVGVPFQSRFSVQYRDSDDTKPSELAGHARHDAHDFIYELFLPAPGDYLVGVAVGSSFDTVDADLSLYDGDDLLQVLCTGTVVAESYKDADDNTWTAANWRANQVLVPVTFTTQFCRFVAATGVPLCYVYLESDDEILPDDPPTVVTLGNRDTSDLPGMEDAELHLGGGDDDVNRSGLTQYETTRYASGDHRNVVARMTGMGSIPANAIVLYAFYEMVPQNMGADGQTISMYRLKRPWIEDEVTWNSFSTGNAWTAGGAESSSDIDATSSADALDEHSWIGPKLIADVQGIVDGTYVNNGWMLRRSDGEDDGKYRMWSANGQDPEYAANRPQLTVVYYEVAAGELIGSVEIVLSASGALTGAGALAGLIALAVAASGGLTGAGALAGNAALTLTPLGVLTGGGALAGAVALALSASGALTGAGSLAGTAALVLTPAGTLSGAGALAGNIPLTMTPAGALTGAGALSGLAALTLTPSGALTGAGELAGNVPLTLTPSGNLSAPGELAGQVSMVLTASVGLPCIALEFRTTPPLA